MPDHLVVVKYAIYAALLTIIVVYSINPYVEYPDAIVVILTTPAYKCLLYALVYPLANFDFTLGCMFMIAIVIADNQVSLVLNT